MVQWIPIDKIQYILQVEPFIVSWICIFAAWFFYFIFLKKISEKRHHNLRRRFNSTTIYLIVSSLITILHWYAYENITQETLVLKLTNYLGLFALLIGAVAIIKLAQIFVYLYLFFSHMSNGVPILIGNMFTFVFSLLILSLIGSNVFGIHVATLLATSAVFSIVLGLALQDTLGNFFSGVALQIDRPFQIGDWIEVHSTQEKWTGQIQEITWRATFLLSFSDELIMIPNKTIAQSQILIFSHQNRSSRFNHAFRFHFDVKIEEAKEALFAGLQTVPGILKDPEPRVLILETNESYLTLKIFYSLSDFGTRYRTGDAVIVAILKAIHHRGLKLAVPSIAVLRD
jgi:small-conductance mechanosensitive channel